MALRWAVIKDRLGTVAVGIAILAIGGLVWWNMFGQGPYRDTCNYSIGCQSYLCLSHGLRHGEQLPSSGRCTKKCSTDAQCGDGYQCVKLSAAARDDLPPFGKPNRACMRVWEP
jgi:hypothetical protein